MDTKTIDLSIKALRKAAQPLAFDANLYEEGVCDTPHAKNAYDERKQIYTAIAKLERHKKSLRGLVWCEVCKLWQFEDHKHEAP